MASILLINPPVTRAELFVRGATETGSVLPPLGLAYIAAVLEQGGHRVEIIDGMAENVTLDAIAAKSAGFDYAGITAVTTFAVRAYETAEAVKRKAGVPVILGGPHPTSLPLEAAAHPAVDYAVAGEGEETMLDLINALSQGRDPGRVAGIYYKSPNGVCSTPERALIPDLDRLPLPARHLLPMDRYKSSEARSRKQPSHSIITSRGCPYNCTFCNKKIFGRKFRANSAARVVEEMAVLKSRFGAKDIAVWDDNFSADKKRVRDICGMLKEKDLSLSWSCECRVDNVDPDLLSAMKAAGCDFIAYGVESGSERVLKSIRKGFDKEQVRAAFRWTKAAKIAIRGYFILGLLGETAADIEETIRFAQELDPDVASFTLWVPLPGTDGFAQAVAEAASMDAEYWKRGIVPEFNFLDKPVYVPRGLNAAALMRLHRKAYRKFYTRPSYVLKQFFSIRNREDIARLWKGVKTIFKS